MRKFKCIRSFTDYLTKDKIYEVKDDEIIFDNGNKSRFLLDGGTIAFVPILNYLVEVTDDKQEKENNLCNYDFDSITKMSTDEIRGGHGNSFYQNDWDTKYQFKNGSSITTTQGEVVRGKRKEVK